MTEPVPPNQKSHASANSFNTPRLIWLAVPVLIALAGYVVKACRRWGENAQSVTDELGREIKIAFPPQRIISLAPSVTETLFALGLGDRIVGVTALLRLSRIRKSQNTGRRHIESERRTVDRAQTRSGHHQHGQPVGKTGAAIGRIEHPCVRVTNPRGVREVIASIRKFGEATGTSVEAEDHHGKCKRELPK